MREYVYMVVTSNKEYLYKSYGEATRALYAFKFLNISASLEVIEVVK